MASASCCGGKSHDHHDHAALTPSVAAKYFCPMCPGVESDHPGDCPKCGMALEPVSAGANANEDDNADLRDMTRRFKIAAALTLPVFLLAMGHLIPSFESWADGDVSRWTQFALTIPVVDWLAGRSFAAAGAPFSHGI